MKNIRYDLKTNEFHTGDAFNIEFNKIEDNFQEVGNKLGKQYVALLSQSNLANPTVNSLINDFGSVPVVRTDVGKYTITPPLGTLIENHTIPVNAIGYDATGNKITMDLVNKDHFLITTSDPNGNFADNILSDQYVSFQVL